ncbi:MAG: hypothetical protein KC467_09575 [Marinomonas atlantica]|nr:hypothetical protein [Marinomonas atlantica]
MVMTGTLNNKRAKQGFLILEVLVAIAVLTGLMVLILPAIHRFESQLTVRQQVLQLAELETFVQDQFRAQFSRLGEYGCLAGTSQVEVGSSAFNPMRLNHYSLDAESDWLQASDIGACASYGSVSGSLVQVDHTCDGLNVGDWMSVSNCSYIEQGQVLSVSASDFKVQVPPQVLTDSVLVSRDTPFYWFIKLGKSGANALWRRPALSGNALELSPNVSHMRMYPVIDYDEDGVADEVRVDFGVMPIRKLAGLLLEYQYYQLNCTLTDKLFSYDTLRGDTWQYDGVCSRVGKLLINVRGER